MTLIGGRGSAATSGDSFARPRSWQTAQNVADRLEPTRNRATDLMHAQSQAPHVHHEIITNRENDRVMFVRTGDGDVTGVFNTDGWIDACWTPDVLARRQGPLPLQPNMRAS